MRTPRFRVRTLMIAVAAAALITCGATVAMRLRRLSGYYRQKAEQVKVEELFARAQVRFFDNLIKKSKDSDESHREKTKRHTPNASMIAKWVGEMSEKRAERLDKNLVLRRDQAAQYAEYLSGLEQKYERAANHPWLTVEPDPPEPE